MAFWSTFTERKQHFDDGQIERNFFRSMHIFFVDWPKNKNIFFIQEFNMEAFT